MSASVPKTSGHPTFCPSLEFDDDTPEVVQDFETLIHLHMPHLYDRVMELHHRVIEHVVQELRDYYQPLARAA